MDVHDVIGGAEYEEAVANVTSANMSRHSNRSGRRQLNDEDMPDEDSTKGRWTSHQDQRLREAVNKIGPHNWKLIASEYLKNERTDVQCLHRWQKVLKPGLIKGHWTEDEDRKIIECINNGMVKWASIAELIPGRIGKQCRERWFNQLDPSLNKGPWTDEEDAILMNAQQEYGNAWTRIAKLLPGRSENMAKNRWNSSLSKRSRVAGIGGASNSRGRAAAAAASPSSSSASFAAAGLAGGSVGLLSTSPKRGGYGRGDSVRASDRRSVTTAAGSGGGGVTAPTLLKSSTPTPPPALTSGTISDIPAVAYGLGGAGLDGEDDLEHDRAGDSLTADTRTSFSVPLKSSSSSSLSSSSPTAAEAQKWSPRQSAERYEALRSENAKLRTQLKRVVEEYQRLATSSQLMQQQQQQLINHLEAQLQNALLAVGNSESAPSGIHQQLQHGGSTAPAQEEKNGDSPALVELLTSSARNAAQPFVHSETGSAIHSGGSGGGTDDGRGGGGDGGEGGSGGSGGGGGGGGCSGRGVKRGATNEDVPATKAPKFRNEGVWLDKTRVRL